MSKVFAHLAGELNLLAVPLTCTCCNVPFVYPLTLSYRGQGSSTALHMEYTDGRSLYQAACDRADHGVIAIGHW